jgi:hypothetical protein
MFATKLRRAATLGALCAALTGSIAVASGPVFAAGGQFGIVIGTVLDSQHNPVSGASIALTAPTGRYSASTDNRGKFRVMGVNVDTYDVRVRKDGFADAVVPNVDALGDQTQDIGTITLRPS